MCLSVQGMVNYYDKDCNVLLHSENLLTTATV